MNQDEFVAWLKVRANSTGVLFSLDNEPDLWADTHAEVHPDPVGYDELVDRNIEYARAIKSQWSNAKVTGFVSYGFNGYVNLQDAPDRAGKGEITSGLQLFGNVTFWLFWENGYAALAALDDDGDGTLRGDELKGLAIWHDRNGNGVSEPGEAKPLPEHGITAVSCRSERDACHPDRIAFSPRGVTFRDGTTRPTFDLILHARDGR